MENKPDNVTIRCTVSMAPDEYERAVSHAKQEGCLCLDEYIGLLLAGEPDAGSVFDGALVTKVVGTADPDEDDGAIVLDFTK